MDGGINMKKIVFKVIQLLTFSRIFWNKKKNIFLTFDDGPHPVQTSILLDILKKYKAKATFFIIGENGENHYTLLQKIYQDGHTIANHTYSHFRYKNDTRQFLEELEKAEAVLIKNNIKSQKIVRIPYGVISIKLMSQLILRGYKIAFWNKDTKDYKLKNPEEVRNHIDILTLSDGDVILLHDYPEVTPIILEEILSCHPDKTFLPL